MIPILFSASESAYTSHGLGPISDATSCIVSEEANGAFELKITLPRTSKRLPQLVRDAQILAAPNPYDRAQPFRIRRITKGLHGQMDVYAQHLSYDLAGVPIGAFSASTAAQAIGFFNSRKLGGDSFTFSTNLSVSNPMTVEEPTAAWDLLGSGDNTLLNNYGGQLKFDRRTVQLLQARGAQRGFSVRYGKNMTELQYEDSSEDLYTGILPYWIDRSDGTLVTGSVQNAGSNYGFTRILPVDLSADFDEQPSASQLNTAGRSYISSNKIGQPTIRIKASFVPPGARGLKTLEDVRLFDTVLVHHEDLQINIQASVVKTAYDVLRERYQYIEIGNRLVTVAQTIAAPTKRIADDAVKSKAIAKGAVTSSKIGAGAVTSSKIDTGAVTSTKLGAGAVSSAALAAGSVISSKLGAGAVNSAALAAGAVIADKIANASVTVTKIQNGAVVADKIAAGAVTGNKVLDQAISYAKLNNTLQVFYNDTIAANSIFSSVITARGSVSCSTLNLNGVTVTPQQISYMTGVGIAAQRTFVAQISGG